MDSNQLTVNEKPDCKLVKKKKKRKSENSVKLERNVENFI